MIPVLVWMDIINLYQGVDGNRGGVDLFIKDTLNYIIREDMSVFIPNVCETLFIEIIHNNGRNVIVGVL